MLSANRVPVGFTGDARFLAWQFFDSKEKEMTIQNQVAEMQQRALGELDKASDLVALDEWRLKYLGKKGELTGFLRGMGQLPTEERPIVGQVVNAARKALEEADARRLTDLQASALEQRLASDRVDVTLPGRPVETG